MPEGKGDSGARQEGAPARKRIGPDDALREANRRLLLAALKADEERDAQTALATAMRELLGRGDADEQAIRTEVKLLRTITANTSSALLLLDARSHPLFINPAGETLFGYRLTEIKDVPFHDTVHHHHSDGTPFPIEGCAIAAAVTASTALHDERAVFICKDGTLLPVRCDVVPLQIGGQPLGAVLEVRDRSAEARAEEAKRDLVALIAHDLRTPLTSVQGHVQMLQRRVTSEGDSARWELPSLESIERAARRMEAMLQELLDASRLESGVVPLSRAPVDISELAARAAAQLTSAEDRERVTVDAPPSAVMAFADAGRIERVVANLIGNALKYSPAHAPLRVEIRRGEGEAVVAVIDRGPGIPADQLPLLFQRYVRLDRTRSDPDRPDPGGTGLGLYIARLIVEAHGGRIWAESEIGKGSTVAFSVPLDAS